MVCGIPGCRFDKFTPSGSKSFGCLFWKQAKNIVQEYDVTEDFFEEESVFSDEDDYQALEFDEFEFENYYKHQFNNIAVPNLVEEIVEIIQTEPVQQPVVEEDKHELEQPLMDPKAQALFKKQSKVITKLVSIVNQQEENRINQEIANRKEKVSEIFSAVLEVDPSLANFSDDLQNLFQFHGQNQNSKELLISKLNQVIEAKRSIKSQPFSISSDLKRFYTRRKYLRIRTKIPIILTVPNQQILNQFLKEYPGLFSKFTKFHYEILKRMFYSPDKLRSYQDNYEEYFKKDPYIHYINDSILLRVKDTEPIPYNLFDIEENSEALGNHKCIQQFFFIDLREDHVIDMETYYVLFENQDHFYFKPFSCQNLQSFHPAYKDKYYTRYNESKAEYLSSKDRYNKTSNSSIFTILKYCSRIGKLTYRKEWFRKEDVKFKF